MTEQQTESVSARKPRVSPKQREANRANAQRSTGPRTLSGKQRSSLNALKHGILSMRAVNPELDSPQECERFNTHRERYFEILRPQDQLQADLAEQLVINRWRMAKLIQFEDIEAWRPFTILDAESEAKVQRRDVYLFDLMVDAGIDHPTVPPDPSSAQIARYRASLNNEYFRALAELRRLKKEYATGEGVYSASEEEGEPGSDDGTNTVPTQNDGTNSAAANADYQTKPNAQKGPEIGGSSPAAEPTHDGGSVARADSLPDKAQIERN